MSLEQRETHDRIYGLERSVVGQTEPMVVSVNGVIASFAVTEFMVFVKSHATSVRTFVALVAGYR
jgi:hypothetical protein